MLKKYLSISLSIFMLANYIPVNCFAQSADFVTQDTRLIVSRINYGGSDLIEEGQQIYNRLMDLYDGGIQGDNLIFLRSQDQSISKVMELQSILEDYGKFLINLDNSQEVLKGIESGEISSFEILTEKYFAEVPDYTEPAILEDYFKRKGIPISEIRESEMIIYNNPPFFSKQSLTDIQVRLEMDIEKIKDILTKRKGKETITKDYLKTIKDIARRHILNLREENLEFVQAIYSGFEEYAAKIFATPESRAEFLEYVWNRTIEIMSKNNPDSAQTLLQGLALHGEDPVKNLQRVLRNLGKEAQKSTRDSLLRMIHLIKNMSEEELTRYIAEVNKKLTPAQRELIEDVYEIIVDKKTKRRLSQLLLQESANSIPGKTTSRTAAIKATGVVAKVVTPVVLILGSLWILNSIVDVDGANNTFAQALSPAELKHKMKEGTASPEEQFAYYIMPLSAEYIEENPLQFASVMFSFAEAATNPTYQKLMNDPIFKIKGLSSSEDIGLNEKLDEEIEKALNKIEISGLELPRT